MTPQPSRDAEIIEGLVTAIKDHSEFRQLSCYSIECLTKALSNKYGRQREAMERAIDCGAASAVMDIMYKYPGQEDVLERCVDCLGRIASDPKTAAQIAHHDGFDVLFSSIVDWSEESISPESISHALYLVETIIAHPNILQTMNCNRLILQLDIILKNGCEDINITLYCVKSLERISRNVDLRKLFHSPEIIVTLLSALSSLNEKIPHIQEQNASNEAYLLAAICIIKILLNLTLDSCSIVTVIRNASGADILLRFQQMIPSENDFLLRLGGRLLCKLLEKDPATIVKQLTEKKITEEEFEQNLDLFLTILQHHPRAIRELSGPDIKDLYEKCSSAVSEKTHATLSRILLVISSSRDAVCKLLRYESIDFVFKSLSPHNATEQSLLNIMEAIQNLVRYCDDSEHITTKLTKEILTLHKDKDRSSNFVASVIRYFVSLMENVSSSENMDEIFSSCVTVAVMAMKTNRQEDIQSNGTSLLLKFFSSRRSPVNLNDFIDSDFVSEIIFNISDPYSDQGDLLLTSLELMSLVVSSERGIQLLHKEKCIGAVSSAMISNEDNDGVISVGIFILSRLSSENYVKGIVGDFKRSCIEVDRMASISPTVRTLGALTMNKRDLELILEMNALELLVECFFLASKRQDFEEQSLVSIIQTLTFIIKRSTKACIFILGFDLLPCASLILSERIKVKQLVESTMLLIQIIICSSSSIDISKWDIVEGITPITSVFQFYLNDIRVIFPAIDLLLLLVKKGIEIDLSMTDAARKIVAFLRDRTFEHGEISVLLKILEFISIACKDDNNSKSFRRWGCVDTIINTIPVHKCDCCDLTTKGRDALQNILTEKDINDSIKKLSLHTKKIDAEFDIINAEATVKRFGQLIWFWEHRNINKKDEIVGMIRKILLMASSKKGSRVQRAYAKLLSTCIETICRSFHGTKDADQLLKTYATDLLKNLEEIPSLHTCNAILCMIKSSGSRLELNKRDATGILIATVQKGDVDADLASCGMKALVAFYRVNCSDVTTSNGSLFFACEYISTALENCNTTGITESLEFLEEVGSKDSLILVDNQVLDVVVDVLKSLLSNCKLDLATFVHGMNIIKIIASTEVGLEKMDSKNMAPALIDVYCKCIGKNAPSSAIESYTLAVTELSKNVNMQLTFNALGLNNFLYETINAHPFDEFIISNTTALIRALKDESSLSKMEQIVGEISSCVDWLEADEEQVSSGLLNLLQDCGNMIFKRTSFAPFDPRELTACLQRVLDVTKTKDDGYVQQKIYFLVMVILHRLLDVDILEEELNMSYFVTACSSIINEPTFVYQASVFAFLGKIVRFENGLKIVLQHDILCNMKKVLASSCGKEAEGVSTKVVEARKAANAMSEEIIRQADSISMSKMCAVAIRSFFCNMDCDVVIQVITSIANKEGGIHALLEIISPTMNQRIPEKIISVAVESLLSANKEENPLSHDHLFTITSICRTVTKAIDLFASFSEEKEGVSALALSPGAFEVIRSILTSKNVECACSAASIFSDCIISGNELVFKRMQEIDVMMSLVSALGDLTKAECEEFVQDAMYIIGSLSSAIGTSQLKVGNQCIECIQNCKNLHKENEYISKVAEDILSDLKENLSEEKDIIKQLQHLSNMHTSAQAVSAKHTIILNDTTEQNEQFYTDRAVQSHDIETQSTILMEMIDTFDLDLSFIDATTILPLIDILVSYSDNLKVVKTTLSILKKLKTLPWIAEMITDQSKLSCIMDMVRQHVTDRNLVEILLRVLALSIRDVSQSFECLTNLGAVSAINKALMLFLEVEEIAISGSEVLSNLFVRYQIGIDIIHQVGIRNSLNQAMMLYRGNDRVIRNVLTCLYSIVRIKESNYTFSEEISKISSILESLHHHQDIVVLILKIFGVFSLSDGLINTMLQNQIVLSMVYALENNIGNADLLRLAAMLLSNLGILEDKKKERDNLLLIAEQGGQTFLLKCIDQHHTNSSLVHVVLKAICDLYDANAFDHENAYFNGMALQHCLRAIEMFDYNDAIMTWASRGISLFVTSEKTLVMFKKLHGIDILVCSLTKNVDSEKFIEYTSLCLANTIAMVDCTILLSNQSLHWVFVFMNCLEKNLDNVRICTYLFSIFALLARKSIALETLSREGVHRFMRAAQIHLDHATIIAYFVEIIGQLSFVPQYACDIILSGCITLLFHLLGAYKQKSSLVAGILQILLNMIRTSDECMLILKASAIETKVKEVIIIYRESCKGIYDSGQIILSFFRERDIDGGDNPRASFGNVTIDRTYFKEKNPKSRHYTPLMATE